MHYLLDTDICSYILKQRTPSLVRRFRQVGASRIAVSVVTYAELRYGLARHTAISAEKMDAFQFFMEEIQAMPWDIMAANHYATLRASLESAGTPLDAMDIMIAAHALALNATLVSNNTRHFKRIAHLKLENWMN